MGYKVMGRSEDIMQGYEFRKGLEGPFNFNGRVVYYDTKEGRYWDPKSDFFLSNTEALQMQGLMSYEYPDVYVGGFVDVTNMSDRDIKRLGRRDE